VYTGIMVVNMAVH